MLNELASVVWMLRFKKIYLARLSGGLTTLCLKPFILNTDQACSTSSVSNKYLKLGELHSK